MEKNTVILLLDEVFTDLTKAVEALDYNSYNKIPLVGSWTAGQVTQHIVLSNEGFYNALNAEVIDTDREIDELVIQLKNILLNYELKMHSPDFIMPELKEYDKTEHLLKITETKKGLEKAIAELDLSKTCLMMELPGLGKVTRLEAIYFVIYHTQRHTHQIKAINKLLYSLN